MPHELEAESAFEDLALAIVGMAGRFPGARDVDEFWNNLSRGVKSIRHLTPEEVMTAGADPASSAATPTCARVACSTTSICSTPPSSASRRARRKRSTRSSACFSNARGRRSRTPRTIRARTRPIGVFRRRNCRRCTGCAICRADPDLLETVGASAVGGRERPRRAGVAGCLQARSARTELSVQTFCSTSLVAVHVACQSLLTQDCDWRSPAAWPSMPHGTGYLYEEGGIVSPDGECRAFDA